MYACVLLLQGAAFSPMRKFGIAAKLYLAFGGIFLLAILAAVVGWQGFQRVADSQNQVIDKAIPGLRQAHRLSELNALIGAAAQQLLRANNESERERASSVLFSHVSSLNILLDDFQRRGFAAPSLLSLRETVQDIAGKLRQQNELVRQRNQLHTHFVSLSDKLIASTDELNELADSLVANAAATTTAITSNLYDLVENSASRAQLFSVFDRLVEVDIDAMERMYELRLRSANLRATFDQVGKESDTNVLDTLRQTAAETLSILKRRISEINDPQRRETANQLIAEMEVDNGPLNIYGFFETRLSLLSIRAQLAELNVETGVASQELNAIVNDLNTTGGALINQVSTSATHSLETSRTLFNSISVISILIAATILWGFIKRDVIRRLLSLESATHSIVEGNYDVEIDDEGNDELSDMGKALHGFRNNAIEKRKVDKELQQHKAHLEELVEERTEQLRETNQKLSEEAQNHALARDKAEQANQAKTAFLATMSHELRTPLSGALGTLHLLSDTQLLPRQRDYVKTVDAANTTLLDIVNDILGYSQLEAGKLKIERREFEVLELLNNVVDLMSVSVQENNNTLRLKADYLDPCWLLGDPGKLHQVLINLIGNANKFTDNGEITLRANYEPSDDSKSMRLQFAVEDTGIGIAAEKQQEIFQAFTQVDTSSARRYGGVGLGLAICDRLVEAMGGAISLKSELGRGTRISFEVTLDITEQHQSSPVDSQPVSVGRKEVDVLMVEDDATNRMVTANYLTSLGHRVTEAENGEQALSFLDSQQFSLVLLDISLPGIDGIQILKHIRQSSTAHIANLPVVAMSAHVFTEEVDEYLSAGMNGFLGKPFSIEDLDRAILSCLNNEEIVVGKPMGESRFDSAVVAMDIDKLGIESVRQMVAVFRETGADTVASLQRAVDQQTPTMIEKQAHKLRGAAGNFGLEWLCKLAADMESRASNKELVTVDEYQALTQEYQAALAALDSYLATYSVQSHKPKKVG